MHSFAEALVAATVEPGHAVLDVACGTGFATRQAASVAGMGGRVAGADINAGMLATARSVTADSEYPISWHEASALDLPFADGEFDAVTCQQGLQFFPDHVAGLTEMARVARPGARVGATVWAEPLSEQSPYLGEQIDMLVRYCGIELLPVQEPSIENEGVLRDWFTAAGLEQVEVTLLQFDVSIPPLDEYLDGHLSVLPWGARWFELDEATRAKATAELSEALARWRTDDGGVNVPFGSFLGVGVVAE